MKYIFLLVSCIPFSFWSLSQVDPKTIKEEVREYEHKLFSGGTLEVLATSGKISISGWDKEIVYVRAIKRAPDRLLSTLTVETTLTDTNALIRTLSDPAPRYTYTYSFFFFNYTSNYTCQDGCIAVDYTIKVPRKTAVRVHSTKDSDIRIKNIDNTVVIKNSRGDVKTDEISGPLEIQTENGDIRITDNHDKVAVTVGDGDIRMYNVLNSVSVASKNGNIDISNIQGTLSIKSKQGDVKAHNITQATTIAVSQGDVYLANAQGPIIVTAKRGYVKVQKAENTCRIITLEGNITLTQKRCKPEESIELQSINGDIRLYILHHIDAQLKAETEQGTISLDRSLTEVYHVAQNVRNLEILLGKRDVQSSKVIVKTVAGNIKIASY